MMDLRFRAAMLDAAAAAAAATSTTSTTTSTMEVTKELDCRQPLLA